MNSESIEDVGSSGVWAYKYIVFMFLVVCGLPAVLGALIPVVAGMVENGKEMIGLRFLMLFASSLPFFCPQLDSLCCTGKV